MPMSKLRLLGAALIFAVGASVAQPARAQEGLTVTPILQKALADVRGKEVLMLTVDYAPGAVEALHRHDAHAFVYVIEGSIIMGVKGGKEVTLTPGQTFYEGPTDIHTVGRNASKTKPARFVVFLLKNQGVDAVLPVK
jgi:quercetin dioxygenase-like cupin family protein